MDGFIAWQSGGPLLTEPDVAITDFALAIECLVFSWVLLRKMGPIGTIQRLFALLFFTIAVGALLGGISHGFLLSGDTLESRIMWSATLLALGLTSLVSWHIGAEIQMTQPWRKATKSGAIVLFILYSLGVVCVTQTFELAVLNLAPALLFLLFGYIAVYRQHADMSVLIGIAGILLIFAASVLQQLGIGIHPVYFTHNAVYHVLQGLAFFMIFNSIATILNRLHDKTG